MLGTGASFGKTSPMMACTGGPRTFESWRILASVALVVVRSSIAPKSIDLPSAVITARSAVHPMPPASGVEHPERESAQNDPSIGDPMMINRLTLPEQ